MKKFLILLLIFPVSLFAYPDNVETTLGPRGSSFICFTDINGNILYKRKGCEKNEFAFKKALGQQKRKQNKFKNKIGNLKDKVQNSQGQAKIKAQVKLKNVKQNSKQNKNITKGIKKCQNGSLPPSFPVVMPDGFGSVNVVSHFDVINPIATMHNLGRHISYYSVLDFPDTTPQGFIDLWGAQEITSTETGGNADGLTIRYIVSGFFQEPGTTEKVKVSGILVVDYHALPFIFFDFASSNDPDFSVLISSSRFLPEPVPPTFGDIDGDNNIDFQDIRFFNRCYKGPNKPFPSSNPDCAGLDLDGDGFIGFGDTSMIFADGFESGDTTAWSNTAP